MAGTRTGRLSSTPNFQNIPKEFKQLWADDKNPALPQAPVVLPPLPLCRGYLVPMTSDEVIIDRDYSQQELRVLAHFEGGALQAAYVKDPWLDLHEFARQLINSMLGTSYERKVIKNTGFGLIYGMGVGSLAERNGTDVAMAKAVKDAYLKTFPGLKDMYAEMKRRAKDDEPIYTWGGREYYVEPPKIIHNRLCTYDYKMVNVLVQGSSACISKEALLRYAEAKPAHHRVMLTVHDEFAVSVPKAEQHQAMSQLRKAMESIELSVPLFSDGKSGKTLATMTAYDKVGKRLDGLPWT
jgi:DNA polymerase I-like protein with 3'-5' exonuclease and polymerase domains